MRRDEGGTDGPLHVWQIVSGWQLNGAVVHARLLSEALAARGHRVTLVTRHGSWLSAQPWNGVEIVESTMDRWPLTEARRLANLAKAQRVDVFHSHMTRADNFGLTLRLLTKIPSVATAHAHTIHPHWFLHDRVIGVSQTTTAFHRARNFVPERRLSTVHGMIPVESFSRVADSIRDDVRREFGALSEETFLIGVLAQIHPRKGQDLLVEALPRLVKALDRPVRVALMGAGPDSFARRLRARADALGVSDAITWAGVRHDIPAVFSAIDVLALPSRAEAFSVAILEAMAMKTPFVATLVGGSAEFAPPDGPAGLLILPDRPAALADALERIARLGDVERAALGERGRRFVEANFSVASQVPKIEAVLRGAVCR